MENNNAIETTGGQEPINTTELPAKMDVEAATSIGLALPDLKQLEPYVQRALFLFPQLKWTSDAEKKFILPQIYLALLQCAERKLDPFRKQCYLVPFKTRRDGVVISITVSMQIAIEELMKRAMQDAKVHHISNGDLIVEDSRTQKQHRIKGCVAPAHMTIKGAVATVYFKDPKRKPEEYFVSARQYTRQANNWDDVGYMLTKCARAHACRSIAPETCGGIYTFGESPETTELEPKELPEGTVQAALPAQVKDTISKVKATATEKAYQELRSIIAEIIEDPYTLASKEHADVGIADDERLETYAWLLRQFGLTSPADHSDITAIRAAITKAREWKSLAAAVAAEKRVTEEPKATEAMEMPEPTSPAREPGEDDIENGDEVGDLGASTVEEGEELFHE